MKLDEFERLWAEANSSTTVEYDQDDLNFLDASDDMVPKLIKLARAANAYLLGVDKGQRPLIMAEYFTLIESNAEVFGDDA